MTESRNAFEAYFAASRKSKGAGKRPTFERFPDGTYKDDHTQRHWWTWQQAQAVQVPPWQPVETAPLDVLVWVSATKRMSGPCIAMHHSRDGWVVETPSEWASIYTPTHWMPFTPPAGPAA